MHSADGTLCVLSLVMEKDRNSTEVLIPFPNHCLLSALLYSLFLQGFSTLMTVTITEMTQVAGIEGFFSKAP